VNIFDESDPISGQLFHLIAHAKFVPDFPETSFIQLGSRQYYLSDLVQKELNFRLVTLTACETGQTALYEPSHRVAHGDDLLGIGRGFLYAGAQAILASQWMLGDGLTLPLLSRFYHAWLEGFPAPTALRNAQLAMVDEFPTLHPVFWGAFQLIGNAD
jgi:CHAT domain-containing protein